MAKYHDLILLTGAGFTKNFGGFLALEMWAQIYNHPQTQQSPLLKRLLQDDHDFESIYSRVTDDPAIPTEEKEKIQRVVSDAYANLDAAIKDWVFKEDAAYPVCWYTLNRLLRLFNGSAQAKGLFFTLNQDLFMERRSGSVCPGVAPFCAQHGALQSFALAESDYVALPPASQAQASVDSGISSHAGIVYIKLHGSYGWVASDGSSRMVIGKDKTRAIASEPLLQAYFNLFTSAIQEGSKKILIIGYGFADSHINAALARGVREHNLQIYVISTSSAESWNKKVSMDGENGQEIIRGLAGYFPYTLLEMFPKDQSETIHYQNLKRSLLDK